LPQRAKCSHHHPGTSLNIRGLTPQGGLLRGAACRKKIKGRKRHVMVDTLGFILKVFVAAANTGDREGLAALAMSMKGRLPRLKKILVDQGYTGKVGEAIANVCGWEVEVGKRDPEHKGFTPEFKRWVVERTFGWLLHERRLSKDYEQWPESSESMIYLASIRLILRRLTAVQPAPKTA
jgi:putative transposase